MTYIKVSINNDVFLKLCRLFIEARNRPTIRPIPFRPHQKRRSSKLITQLTDTRSKKKEINLLKPPIKIPEQLIR